MGINWVKNELEKTTCSEMNLLDTKIVGKALDFVKSFEQYKPTVLAKQGQLAKKLGLKNIYVKDESTRFGLNAFKVLGGSYAMAMYIADKLGMDIRDLDHKTMISAGVRKKLGDVTFYTATDGNHGRSVAWTARELQQKAVIYMPKGTSKSRFDNIAKEGAQVFIKDMNCDECAKLAFEDSKKDPTGVLMQDTAFPGYTQIPGWIMQGYAVMALEACLQLDELGEKPTHVFLQAGMGSMAGGCQALLTNYYGKDAPVSCVVEAQIAECLYRSVKAGEIVCVGGELNTIMAGLACGEPNPIAWEILKNNVECFVSAPDWVTAKGMRVLASPLEGDTKVKSGESGAVGTGLVYSIMTDPNLKGLKETLGLNENSTVLLFSTEGDTDPEKYQSVVWDGEHPSNIT